MNCFRCILRYSRLCSNMSVVSFAKLLGIPPRTFYSYLSGSRSPSINKMYAIYHSLEVNGFLVLCPFDLCPYCND